MATNTEIVRIQLLIDGKATGLEQLNAQIKALGEQLSKQLSVAPKGSLFAGALQQAQKDLRAFARGIKNATDPEAIAAATTALNNYVGALSAGAAGSKGFRQAVTEAGQALKTAVPPSAAVQLQTVGAVLDTTGEKVKRLGIVGGEAARKQIAVNETLAQGAVDTAKSLEATKDFDKAWKAAAQGVSYYDTALKNVNARVAQLKQIPEAARLASGKEQELQGLLKQASAMESQIKLTENYRNSLKALSDTQKANATSVDHFLAKTQKLNDEFAEIEQTQAQFASRTRDPRNVTQLKDESVAAERLAKRYESLRIRVSEYFDSVSSSPDLKSLLETDTTASNVLRGLGTRLLPDVTRRAQELRTELGAVNTQLETAKGLEKATDKYNDFNNKLRASRVALTELRTQSRGSDVSAAILGNLGGTAANSVKSITALRSEVEALKATLSNVPVTLLKPQGGKLSPEIVNAYDLLIQKIDQAIARGTHLNSVFGDMSKKRTTTDMVAQITKNLDADSKRLDTFDEKYTKLLKDLQTEGKIKNILGPEQLNQQLGYFTRLQEGLTNLVRGQKTALEKIQVEAEKSGSSKYEGLIKNLDEAIAKTATLQGKVKDTVKGIKDRITDLGPYGELLTRIATLSGNNKLAVTLKDVMSEGAAAYKGLEGIFKFLSPLGDGFKTMGKEATDAFRELEEQLVRFRSGAVTWSMGLLMLGTAIGTPFVVATRELAKFSDTMGVVRGVVGATENQFAALEKTAIDLGRTTRFTALEVAQGMEYLGKAGFEANEVISAIPTTLKLAQATAIDLGRAAEVVTNIMTTFNKPIDELPESADILTLAVNKTNASLDDLAYGFTYVGSLAKGLGGDFNDVIASLAMLHNAGFKSTMAGTALRGMLDALFNPTKDEAAALAELSQRMGGIGLALKDSEGNFVGFVRLVEQLEAAGFRSDEALRVFGQRAGPGVAALLRIGSAELRKFSQDLDRAAGTTSQMAEVMDQTFMGRIKNFGSALEGLGIVVAHTLEPMFRAVLNAASAFINGLTNLLTELGPIGKGIIYLTAGIAGLTASIGALTFAWIMMMVPFKQFKAIASTFLGLITGVTKASLGSAAALASSTGVFASFFAARVAAAKQAASTITLVEKGMETSLKGTTAAVVETVGAGLLGGLAAKLGNLKTTLATFFLAAIANLRNAFTGATFSGILLRIGTFLLNPLRAIVTLVIAGLLLIPEKLSEVVDRTTKQLDRLKLSFENTKSSLAQFQQNFNATVTAINQGKTGSALEESFRLTEEAAKKLLETFRNLPQEVRSNLSMIPVGKFDLNGNLEELSILYTKTGEKVTVFTKNQKEMERVLGETGGIEKRQNAIKALRTEIERGVGFEKAKTWNELFTASASSIAESTAEIKKLSAASEEYRNRLVQLNKLTNDPAAVAVARSQATQNLAEAEKALSAAIADRKTTVESLVALSKQYGINLDAEIARVQYLVDVYKKSEPIVRLFENIKIKLGFAEDPENLLRVLQEIKTKKEEVVKQQDQTPVFRGLVQSLVEAKQAVTTQIGAIQEKFDELDKKLKTLYEATTKPLEMRLEFDSAALNVELSKAKQLSEEKIKLYEIEAERKGYYAGLSTKIAIDALNREVALQVDATQKAFARIKTGVQEFYDRLKISPKQQGNIEFITQDSLNRQKSLLEQLRSGYVSAFEAARAKVSDLKQALANLDVNLKQNLQELSSISDSIRIKLKTPIDADEVTKFKIQLGEVDELLRKIRSEQSQGLLGDAEADLRKARELLRSIEGSLTEKDKALLQVLQPYVEQLKQLEIAIAGGKKDQLSGELKIAEQAANTFAEGLKRVDLQLQEIVNKLEKITFKNLSSQGLVESTSELRQTINQLVSQAGKIGNIEFSVKIQNEAQLRETLDTLLIDLKALEEVFSKFNEITDPFMTATQFSQQFKGTLGELTTSLGQLGYTLADSTTAKNLIDSLKGSGKAATELDTKLLAVYDTLSTFKGNESIWGDDKKGLAEYSAALREFETFIKDIKFANLDPAQLEGSVTQLLQHFAKLNDIAKQHETVYAGMQAGVSAFATGSKEAIAQAASELDRLGKQLSALAAKDPSFNGSAAFNELSNSIKNAQAKLKEFGQQADAVPAINLAVSGEQAKKDAVAKKAEVQKIVGETPITMSTAVDSSGARQGLTALASDAAKTTSSMISYNQKLIESSKQVAAALNYKGSLDNVQGVLHSLGDPAAVVDRFKDINYAVNVTKKILQNLGLTGDYTKEKLVGMSNVIKQALESLAKTKVGDVALPGLTGITGFESELDKLKRSLNDTAATAAGAFSQIGTAVTLLGGPFSAIYSQLEELKNKAVANRNAFEGINVGKLVSEISAIQMAMQSITATQLSGSLQGDVEAVKGFSRELIGAVRRADELRKAFDFKIDDSKLKTFEEAIAAAGPDAAKILQAVNEFSQSLGIKATDAVKAAINTADVATGKLEEVQKGVVDAGNALANAANQIQQAPADTASIVAGMAQSVTQIQTAVTSVQQMLSSPLALTVTTGDSISAIQAVIAEIERLIDTIKRANGVELSIGGSVVAAEGRQAGGLIPGYAAGGVFRRPTYQVVPGYGSGDRVPALLEPGEFIIRKAAVQKLGLSFLKLLNSGMLKLYNVGGSVSRLPSVLTNAFSSLHLGPPAVHLQSGGMVPSVTGGRDVVDVWLRIGNDPKPYVVQSQRDQVQGLVGALKQLSRGLKRGS